jgi:hypothetical protein
MLVPTTVTCSVIKFPDIGGSMSPSSGLKVNPMEQLNYKIISDTTDNCKYKTPEHYYKN